MTGNRYSVPIHGKYLVIIANPVKHPMHVQFPVSLPSHTPCPQTIPLFMSVLRELIGGHFSA
jgi:hypothetical protein